MATVDYAHVRNSTSILEGGQIAIAIKIGKIVLDIIDLLQFDIFILSLLEYSNSIRQSVQYSMSFSSLDACQSGDIDKLKVLLNSGLNPNGIVEGRTPLTLAAYHGQEGAVCYLLDHGASVDRKDGWGEQRSTKPVRWDTQPLYRHCCSKERISSV